LVSAVINRKLSSGSHADTCRWTDRHDEANSRFSWLCERA